MDVSAKEFRWFTAKVKRLEHTAVLSETTERNGAVRMQKSKAGVSGIAEFGEPDPSIVRLGGKTVDTYYPKANTVQIIDVGKSAGALEQFSLLGFGTTEAEIRKGWEVRLGGTETVGGVRTTRVELLPKGAETKKMIARIELWIPDGQGNPVQEKITQPSKDYTLIQYSEVKVNAPLAQGAFDFKLPANVKRITPGK